MVMARLLLRLLFARVRLLLYAAFILTTTVFFYWASGGFEKRSASSTVTKAKAPSMPNKVDTHYPVLVKRYCNYPMWNASHDFMDNAGQTNLRLRGLVITTRHGDRAPLLPFPAHLNVPRCGLWDSEDADLFHRYRSDLTSMGASGLPIDSSTTAFSSFSTGPSNERCRPGHLTAIGTVQMIHLGRRLREHYQKTWSFSSITTECKPRSTVYPRTYQSALAFLYGWTGGADGDPRGINVNEKGQKCKLRATDTTYFCSEQWCMCPNRIEAYRRDFHQRLASFTRIDTRDKDIKGILEKIGAVLESPKLEDPLSAFDTLMGYACHQEALPCTIIETAKSGSASGAASGKKEVCVAKDWLIRLYNEVKNAENIAVKHEAGKNLVSVESAPILTQLSLLTDELTSSPDKSVFEYNSGHDVTLRPLLSALGLWDGGIPPYASYVAFELIEDTNKKINDKPVMYFRVIYNGDDMTQKVSSTICKESVLTRFDEAVFKLCTVDGLLEYAKKILGGDGKQYGDEWVKLCR